MNRKVVITAALFFVLGFLAGIAVETEVLKPGRGGSGPSSKPSAPPLSPEMAERITQTLAAARENPEDVRALRELAGLYFKLENFDEASDWYKKVLVLDPSDIEALLNQGYCLWKLQRTSEAMDAFRLAARNAPLDFRTWYNMAIVLCDQGMLKEAKAALERASQLNPGYPGIEALQAKIRKREADLGG